MKKTNVMVACILGIEAFRFTDQYVLTPLYHAIQNVKRRENRAGGRDIHIKKQVIGFVGKYDSDEKL